MLKLFFTYFLMIPLILPGAGLADDSKDPVAKFSFNNKKEQDEVGGQRAKLIGTSYTEDRFGNTNSAVYLFGHEYSYINLGTAPVLKPKTGSISLWCKIDGIVYAGTGGEINPILLTKCADRDDYYEAYAIYFNIKEETLSGAFSLDSTKQCTLYSTAKFERHVWHHLILTYNNDSTTFYIDGKPVSKAIKPFEVKFNPLDSVLLGTTGNKKNNRYINAAIDDVEFYNVMLTHEQVKALYHAPNPNKLKILINWILTGLGILLGIVLIYLFIRYRFSLTLKRERERLELANTLLSNELRVNRALMNPHFMFNSLNTLHHYILTHNVDKASHYLVKFSKLIRKILDSNLHDSILLEQEIDLIGRYLEIESLRFKETIVHSISIAPDVIPSVIVIPIMMLQPFVENSIWHGLRDKTGDKIIRISFSLRDNDYLECVIEDNGTGRKNKRPASAEKKSLATNFVLQRLSLLNKIHKMNCSLLITDKENGQGTIVKIILPILNKVKHDAAKIGDN